nr:immunoglobulin heavy chain junction region [Mus musculus]
CARCDGYYYAMDYW